jgi:hypothetical protein
LGVHRFFCGQCLEADVMFARSDLLDPGRAVRDVPSKLGAAFTFVSLFMGVGFALQQYEENNEATTQGLSTYTQGLFQKILDETDNENELDFGVLHINTTFYGVQSESIQCSASNLGISTSIESMGCLAHMITPDTKAKEDDEPVSCSIHWKCQVPLNVSGTIDVNIPSIPIQWQSMIWTASTVSRKIRNATLGQGGKQHLTSYQGILTPRGVSEGTDQHIMCGESRIVLRLTRGFSVVQLGSNSNTSAGLQLGFESVTREQCLIETAALDNKYSVQFRFSVSENIQIETTTTLLSDIARASLALSLFVSALSVLRVVKSVLQKAIDTVYIRKYKKKDLPIDVVNRKF